MPEQMDVDLRSDTVTRPCARMRKAMAEAEVDDAVLGDDPTVKRLEIRAAELTGKEAALFVPSGCMANLISVMCHAPAGSEIIVAENSHIHCAEAGSYARIAQVNKWPLPVDAIGRFDPAQVAAAIHVGYGLPGGNSHHPTTHLLCLENTNNFCGGTVQSSKDMQASVEAAKRKAPWIKIHLDGARLFNAAVALEVPAKTLTAAADSVSFCLSKGLGAPVGSLVCGTQELITQAIALRKMLGGGMRQAGVLAACGLVALEDENLEGLSKAHGYCRRLAEGLSQLPGITLDLDAVHTNILFFTFKSDKGNASWLVGQLKDRGVRCMAMGDRVRMVTHRDNNADQVEATLKTAQAVFV